MWFGFVFSLSHSTTSISSGSSLGSLASTGSQGSQSSVAASLSDIYIDPCQRLTYELPEIDREALLQRVERVLKCNEEDVPLSSSYSQFDCGTPRTAVSQNLTNSSSDVASGVGYLPTYEQHLERQKCNHHATLPTSQVDLTNSLQALGLGPFTSRLIASTSVDCWQPPPMETVVVADDNQFDCHAQSVFNHVGATQTCGYICLGQSDASSGVSAEGVGGSDCALAGEVNRSPSRHVSSSSATETDCGICDASVQQ